MTWAACGAAIGYKFPTTAIDPVASKLISTYLPTPNAARTATLQPHCPEPH